MSSEEKIIWDAEFNDAVTTYWLLNGILLCIVTVVGIVFLPIWFLVGKWATRKYLASHTCTLTDRSLKVSKGILTKIEKTVPLDKITDVGIVQGPIMRFYDIEATFGRNRRSVLGRFFDPIGGHQRWPPVSRRGFEATRSGRRF